MSRRFDSTRGNMLFILLICIIGFAALVYAVSASNTGNGKSAADEKAQLTQAQTDNCTSQVENAVIRLQTVGACEDDQISYELPNGDNVNPDAPADKHCHIFDPAGAGASPCGTYLESDCDLTALNLGEECGGLYYIGSYSAQRYYAQNGTSDGTATWGTFGLVTGATSANGMTNTNTLVSLGSHPAANLCRALGPDWFLPSRQEAIAISTGLDDTPSYWLNAGSANYWASNESNDEEAAYHWRSPSFPDWDSGGAKMLTMNVKCVRND